MVHARATPRQRDRAIRTLGLAYRDGLLSTGTFEHRVDVALRVRTARQLRGVLADLPGVDRLRTALEESLRTICSPTVPTAAAVNLVLPQTTSRLLVGRRLDCDVTFTDASVSRCHALLRREPGGWTVHDLGSTNGTWVNGQRVHRQHVHRGDDVAFGRLLTRVV